MTTPSKLQDFTFPTKINLEHHIAASIAEHAGRLLKDIESKVNQFQVAQRRS